MDEAEPATDVRPRCHPPHVFDYDVFPVANFVELILHVLRDIVRGEEEVQLIVGCKLGRDDGCLRHCVVQILAIRVNERLYEKKEKRVGRSTTRWVCVGVGGG